MPFFIHLPGEKWRELWLAVYLEAADDLLCASQDNGWWLYWQVNDRDLTLRLGQDRLRWRELWLCCWMVGITNGMNGLKFTIHLLTDELRETPLRSMAHIQKRDA